MCSAAGSDHLIFKFHAAIEIFQAVDFVHVEGGEAVKLDGADISARSLDPQDFDHRAGQRVFLHDLGRGVAAAEIGDPLVGAEEV